MSAFARYLHPLPASRRAYSSFFSSKPGGGRYFNSAKPPKSAVVAGSSATAKNNAKVEPGAVSPSAGESKGKDGSSGAATGSGSNSGANPLLKANGQEASATNASPDNDNSGMSTPLASAFGHARQHYSLPQHPVMNPKDFKLHQFFSLHRPLLLISNPPSIFEPAPPSSSTFGLPSSEADSSPQANSLLLNGQAASPDDGLDITIDADAEAARQLTRALTMSRAGPAVSWEATLQRLGLDVGLDADRVNLQEQMDREWDEVMMDSTKRKRKKKMKKHKLKKRRKATRATRMKNA